MSEIRGNIAKNVKRLRERRNWNQTDLGRRAGVGQRTVSNMEAEKNVSVKSLELVARALGVAVIELMMPPSPQGESLTDRIIYMAAEARSEYNKGERDEGGTD